MIDFGPPGRMNHPRAASRIWSRDSAAPAAQPEAAAGEVSVIDRIRNAARALRACDSGATDVEYAIMVGFIAVVIVAGVTLLGTAVNGLFASSSGI